jgi:hypothetical protein
MSATAGNTGKRPVKPRLTRPRSFRDDTKTADMAEWIRDLTAWHETFQERIEQRQGLLTPNEGPDWADLGETFPSWKALGRDAILQPPKPQITPSTKILRLAAERDTECEAAD